MGLDIRAYANLQPTEPHEYDEETCYEARHFRAHDGPGVPSRISGLKDAQCYVSDTPAFRFRAGSYSGYNDWRNELSTMGQGRAASLVWEDPTGPFAELIHFSDCEGTIGPEVASRLFQDFQAFHDKAKRWATDDGDWFLDRYEKWMHAFEMAADNGAVDFH